MTLDILSPKGRESLRQEREAVELFLVNFREYGFIETNKDAPADIDGFIIRERMIISGVEVKCRNMTFSDLKHRFNMKWLITADKLERGVKICQHLGTDFRGFLYLVPDRMLLIVPIYSFALGWLTDPEYEYTTTQATINGGEAKRLNAYVDVSNASVVAEL